jgi:CRP-like cAMP-binding protein/DNA-binding CsgD family transcriptional regulator
MRLLKMREGNFELNSQESRQGNTKMLDTQPWAHEPLDVLDYLPRSTVLRYGRGQVIYDSSSPVTHLYLVLDGRVKICRTRPDGRKVVLGVYGCEELFGRWPTGNPPQQENAVALDAVELMAWTPGEIQNLMMSRPEFAAAVVQILIRRLTERENRIESFAGDNVDRRLAQTLVQMTERHEPSENAAVKIPALKHQLLSEYVVTSRPTVTHWMNCFRREGLLRYSRNAVCVYPNALKEWLKSNSDCAPRAAVAPKGSNQAGPESILTSRQREVLALVSAGLKNREIAQQLFVTEQTVKNHLQKIFEKLGVSDRQQACRCLAARIAGARPEKVKVMAQRAGVYA